MAERIRVLVEFGGTMYVLGIVNSGLALRRAGDPLFGQLQPFPTLGEAKRVRDAFARTQLVQFPVPNTATAASPHRAHRHGHRRPRPTASTRASTPPPASLPSAASPAEGTAAGEGPRRTAPTGGTFPHRRPNAETRIALDAALDRLETPSP
jgi:hypothetical protein